ncbi:globin family protein [Roseobacter weihaiensis]|uniref:hypothetical protein n=1 Tax=Roseobacter weihaiensis TaxID=2763262 RepID=UPI0022229F5E|nr:hypothetical protein [Roseobacter sp. H9]
MGGRRYYAERHGHMDVKLIHAHVPIRREDAEICHDIFPFYKQNGVNPWCYPNNLCHYAFLFEQFLQFCCIVTRS